MIRVNFDELLKNDRRSYFRVAPAVEEPVLLITGGGSFPLLDISGNGCSLPSTAAEYLIEDPVLTLKLPGCSERIRVGLRVVRAAKDFIGAEFVSLAKERRDLILRYVRLRELEIARRMAASQVYNC